MKKFSKKKADEIVMRAIEFIDGLFDEYEIDEMDDATFYQYLNHVWSHLKEEAEQVIAESIDYLDLEGK